MTAPQISIITPMHNEADNVEGMVRETAEGCAALAPFEMLIVDDGSTDATVARAEALQSEFPWLRIIQHKKACGQSSAVLSGVKAARAPICATLDGDLQNPPAEVPKLVKPLMADQTGRVGLVAGQRIKRMDTNSKRLASRAANTLRAWVLKDDTRDTGCGAKAFRRDVFLLLPFFDHIHRYLPALVKREGYEVILVDVEDRSRVAGTSNYTNLHRAIVGASDLFGVWWLMRRRKLPVVSERGHSDAS
ncbi:dolichol-phosphate mannosyltransferase [Rubricella aquisinus]|uniref:Dolichol-phosphate mannosyltransferase n=1 Tax=Rubricella aquisinus TaxID=2028108 RepID=A0A840WLB8_9RHOB|nr:glycosyltransferase family 2 protein [Rubricella aquisinus]MBB5515849.1 dolichol-phosphate mannosyltransferase [Rubricella aquisinus]